MSAIYSTSVGVADPEVLAGIADCFADHFGVEMRRRGPFPEPQGLRRNDMYILARAPGGQMQGDATVAMPLHRREAATQQVPTRRCAPSGCGHREGSVHSHADLCPRPGAAGRVLGDVFIGRLRQEFCNLPFRRELLAVRSIKEALPEMGHTFGLAHCPNPACTMSLAIHIRQLGRKRTFFCRDCESGSQKQISMLRQSAGIGGKA